jgi:hypothetical protein
MKPIDWGNGDPKFDVGGRSGPAPNINPLIFLKKRRFMTLSYRVAKAGKIREDGKCFNANTLKMFAKEDPNKYAYLDGPQELWIKKEKPEKKKHANFS